MLRAANERFGLKTRRIHAVERIVIPRDEIDAEIVFQRAESGAEPVACYLKIRIVFVYFGNVPANVVVKRFPAKIFITYAVVFNIGFFSELFNVCVSRRLRIVRLRCPTFPVDPNAVNTPFRKFFKLRDKKVVRI